jgi:hypothetical protein
MRPRGLYIEKSVRTVMSVRSVMVGYPPSAWPRKSGHRCDHCGSQFGDMRPWDWPPDCPTHHTSGAKGRGAIAAGSRRAGDDRR